MSFRYEDQATYPLAGTQWNPGPAVLEDYRAPSRERAALHRLRTDVGWTTAKVTANELAYPLGPLVTVYGTLRNEREAFLRSWAIWSRQRLPDWLTVEYVVLDEGSTDGVDEAIAELQAQGAPITYVRTRPPGDPGERSCTLAFNWCARHLARGTLLIPQWWDRIPGSFDLLRGLVEPHITEAGIATSGISRHIGGSSSLDGMPPGQLRALLSSVPWRDDPIALAKLCGPRGGHCAPGGATESSMLCIPREELLALGGWDERYRARASYVNVDLFRRVIGSGLRVRFLSEPTGANYHQSHPCPTGRAKPDGVGLLADRGVVRNGGRGGDWGSMEVVEVRR